jgi:hypothetical protein
VLAKKKILTSKPICIPNHVHIKKQQYIPTLDHLFTFAIMVTVLCFARSVFHICVLW